MALIFIAHKYTNVGLTISQYYLKVKTVDTGELIKKGFRLEMGKNSFKNSLNEPNFS